MTQAMYRLPAVPSDQRKPTTCTAEQDAPMGLSGDNSQRPSSPPRSSGGIRALTATSISPRRPLPEPILWVTHAGSP